MKEIHIQIWFEVIRIISSIAIALRYDGAQVPIYRRNEEDSMRKFET